MESLGWEREVRRARRQLTITTKMPFTYYRMDRRAKSRARVRRER
jgi:hypothetical protein